MVMCNQAIHAMITHHAHNTTSMQESLYMCIFPAGCTSRALVNDMSPGFDLKLVETTYDMQVASALLKSTLDILR